jgi:transposase InsO family protein
LAVISDGLSIAQVAAKVGVSRAAVAHYGAPEQILTDHGKVFTGRFNHPPAEVLFHASCRQNGIEHLLTQPRSPTTTGKIERFHRSMRAEFLIGGDPFASVGAAQRALDAWVAFYNTERPHQGLAMATPASRFLPNIRPAPAPAPAPVGTAAPPEGLRAECGGSDWVSRRVTTNGVVVRVVATGQPGPPLCGLTL